MSRLCAEIDSPKDQRPVTKSVVIGDHHSALLRARRRRERWSAEDDRLYQRHQWWSEGYHGEAET